MKYVLKLGDYSFVSKFDEGGALISTLALDVHQSALLQDLIEHVVVAFIGFNNCRGDVDDSQDV